MEGERGGDEDVIACLQVCWGEGGGWRSFDKLLTKC